ncbi:MAG: hypothetical protein ACXWQO_17605 [Bdellovibrionota bacterium]
MENWLKQNQIRLEVAAVLLAIAAYLLRWLHLFMIWPDSSLYLTAGMNFVRHGTLFVYTNYPSGSFAPITEMYADYPPGFALYLAAFYAILHDPISTAVIAQSTALIAFAILSWQMGRALGLSFLWRAAAIFFFVFFVSFNVIFSSLLNEALYISLSLGTFLACLALMKESRLRNWVIAYACLLCSATVRWNGLANGIFLLFPILYYWRREKTLLTLGRLLIAALAGFLPNILWFYRNSLYLHKGTAMHDVSHMPHILWEKVGVPFENMALRFGFGHFWIFLFVLAFALSPVYFKKQKISLTAFWLLVAGMIAQFLVIYVLTLLFSVTPLDDRYLSPAYTFFAFLLFYAANAYTAEWKLHKLGAVLALIFALVAIPFIAKKLSHAPAGWVGKLVKPPEYYVWQEIFERNFVKSASHYFTDDDFVHEIFIEKPHRLLFTNHIAEPNIEARIRGSGPSFFFVLHEGSEVQAWVENTFQLHKPKFIRENFGKFVVYHGE